jgi:hypothetical protein
LVHPPSFEDLKKYLLTPKDISQMPTERQATIIVLSFIGYIARPTGISEELMAKCAEAFNAHRGKVEWEIEAVEKILKGGDGA